MQNFKLRTLNSELRTVFICLILFLIPTLSPAQDFTATTIGDYGNVAVMEVTGNYDARNPDGTINDAPRQEIAKEFYKTNKDEYDFLVIFTNFDFQMPDEEAIAFYSEIRNDTQGIGLEFFDNSALYGSSGKLQGMVDMGNISNIETNPPDPGFRNSLSTLSHELLHRWAANVSFIDSSGNTNTSLLGKDGNHWSFLLDSDGSVLYGNDWQDNGDGTFTSLAARKYYSPLDLYLMGFYDRSQVPPMLLIDNPGIDPARAPEAGVAVEGTARYITIDDIIAAEGERIPGPAESRKTFKTAFILITAPGTFTGYEIYGIENIRNGWITGFSILTDGQGIMQVALSPKEDLPFNPGIIPPAVNPRTLPPDIDDGVTWLMNNQGIDGSWMYLPQTAGRDTAAAVLALKNFDAAQQNYSNGLQWLNAETSGNMDYLSRKIEAIAGSGQDVTALTDKLLSRQNADGGWGGNKVYESNLLDTSFALKALAAYQVQSAEFKVQGVIAGAVEYLKSGQNPDGGWGGYDGESTVEATANVLLAFNKYRNAYTLDEYIGRGIAWLLSGQNPDGGFGNSPGTVYDSALATLVLREFDISTDITNNALNYILDLQSENGSWYESPYQTALAVSAVWKATIDPDLSIRSSDITFIPSAVTSLPSNVVIKAKIWNLGKTAVPQAKAALYEGAVSGRNKVAEQTLAFPGQTPVTVTFPVTVTDSSAQRFHISVDPENLVKESNEANNTSLKILYPDPTYDFEILASDISVSADTIDIFEDVTISTRVTNRGTMDAYDVQLKYYIDETGEPFDIAVATVDIPAGATVTNEITWRTNRAGENLPVTVHIDPFNSFGELSEENNRAVAYLTVNDATEPNLTVSYRDIVITPEPAEELGNATISCIVKNEGFSDASNIKVNFYRGVPGENGELIGTQSIPALNAGGSSMVSIDWTGITDSGERIIYIRADPDDLIKEIKEDDNDAFTTLKILSLPDFAISTYSISFNPLFPKDRDTVSIAAAIQNSGEQGAQNVTVTALEGDTLIGSQTVPSIAGLSQANAFFEYDTTGKPGVHEITVIVDPDNTVAETSEDNNRASRAFGVQDANLWLTGQYISPNGDGVKDSTQFFFRLETPQTVKIIVVDKKGEIVRTFSGEEFENTTGGSITWDGLDDYGMVVDDGQYRIQILDINDIDIGSLLVIVDNNRSPLTDAIGTKYLLNNNLTCKLPRFGDWDWLPDESGVVFSTDWKYYSFYPHPEFLAGVYTMAPDGEDIRRISPEVKAPYLFTYHYLSPDGERVAFTIKSCGYTDSWGQCYGSVYRSWVADTDGQNLILLPSSGIGKWSWSPDGRYLAYRDYNKSADSHELWIMDVDGQKQTLLDSQNKSIYGVIWSPDGNFVAYLKYIDKWVQELWISNIDGSNKIKIDTGEGFYDYGVYYYWSPDSKKIAYKFTNPDCNYNCPTELRVSDMSANKKTIVSSYPGFYEVKWINNQKIVFIEDALPGNKHKIWIGDASGNGNNIKVIDDYDWIAKIYIAPDRQSFAFIDTTESESFLNDGYSYSLKISDLEGNTYVLYETPNLASGYRRYIRNIRWSPDGDKIFFTELIVTGYGELFQNRAIVINIKTQKETSFGVPYFYQLQKWLSDGISIIGVGYSAPEDIGLYVLNSKTGGLSFLDSSLPVSGQTVVSPLERYITYDKLVDQSSMCHGKYSNLWAISSLLNLTADLRATRDKSAVVLKGIAADLNFEGYMLEYADAKNPDIWNPVIPPSEMSVINDVFTTWVPPYEGTFYVRLTVRDKAGNAAIEIKRVSWGIFSSITNIYKENEIFSPNGDGVKDVVELHYRVLEPVHLDFDIYDEDNNLITTIQKDHAYPVEDYITWDGRDSSGNIVPDGKYRIKVFTYEFFVEVDNTLPDVSIEPTDIDFESIVCGDEDETCYQYIAGLAGHAVDNNLKTWVIEYGEGENPQEWFELKRGEDLLVGKDEDGNPVVDPIEDTRITSFTGAGIGWLGGKKFKMAVEDFAGNRSAYISKMVEEKIIFYTWDEKDTANKSSIIDVLGLHTIGVVETVKEPVVSMALQYRKAVEEGEEWQEGALIVNPESYDVEIPWDSSHLDPDTAYTVRVKAVDILGNEYYSDTLILGHAFSIKFDCEYPATIFAVNSVEELALLKFRIMSEEDPDYATWTDFRIYDTAEGNVIPTGKFTVSLPHDLQDDIRYIIEMSGAGVSSKTYSATTINSCNVEGKLGFGLDVKQIESRACDLLAPGTVNLSASIVIEGSVSDITLKSLTYYIRKSPETWNLLRSFDLSKEPGGSVTVDTGTFAEGTYPVRVILGYLEDGSDREKSASGSLIVDRVLPTAGMTYPGGSLMLCPLKVSGPEGEWYGIPVEGIATDNIQVKRYELYYSTGENPDNWLSAMTRKGDEIVSISGKGSVQGQIGIWDVTKLKGTTFYLKLRVVDAAGNVSCYIMPAGFSIDTLTGIANLSVDKYLFSPNGDGAFDELEIGYEINEYATVGVKVFKLIKTADGAYILDSAPVRTIESGLQHLAGTENTSWDGKDDTGAVVPDGRYGIAVSATDSCGNTNMKWIATEIDNTPPTTVITYPKSYDTPGNITEVQGSADDVHFRSYILEFGQGAAPDEWLALSEKTAPVKDNILGRWNTFSLDAGMWTLRLTAVDTAGNSSSTSVTLDLAQRKNLIKDLAADPQLFSPNDDGKLESTNIKYELADAGDVKIEISDSDGAVKKTYTTTTPSAGTYTYTWDGKNDQGIIVPDGDYSVKLTAVLSSDTSVTQEETITVFVDATPPVVDITTPQQDSYIRTDVTVNGTISDENLLEYSITYTGDAGTELLDTAGQSREDYTFGILNNLPEGSYTLDISAKDAGGNTTVKTIAFTIDRTAPKVTLETPEDGEYYGSDKNTINITGSIVEENLETYSLRYGPGESPAEWTGLLTGDTLPVEQQLFTWKVGKDDGIPDGLYTLFLYARDKAGLEAEVKVKVMIDNTPPEVLITSPQEGDYVKEPVDVKGTVFDQNLEQYTIELSEGNCSSAFKWAAIKTADSPVQNGLLVKWQTLPPDGDYCLKLTAVDKLEEKTGAKTNIKVDTHPPTAPELSGKAENKADARLEWTRNTETDLAGYNLYRDNQKVNTDLISDTDYIDTGLSDGFYSYTVKAVDLAGWESEPSNEIRITIDLTGPDARISSPRDSSKVSGLVDIKGTAYSSDDFRQYRVYVGQGAEPSSWSIIRTSPVPIPYGILTQWDTTGLGEGELYSIRLEAEDIPGNVNTHRITVTIDNTPPAGPVLISAIPDNSDITVSWQANTETDLAGYLLYRNGRLVNVQGIVTGDLKPYLLTGTTYTDEALPDGMFTYYLAAMDDAGNISDPSNSIEVNMDTHPPQATIVEPDDGFRFEDKILVRAESPDIDITSIQFEYKKAEDTGWTNLGDAVTTQPYMTYLDPASSVLSYGDYNLRAVATDTGGRTDPSPSLITVTYTDLTAPDVPVDLKALTNGKDVTLTWTANTEPDIDGYNIYRTIDSIKTKINPEIVKDITYTDSGLADGAYSYEITAIDIYGNEGLPSDSVPAKIYAPLVDQPYTPAGQNVIPLSGSNAKANHTVEMTIEDVAGSVLRVNTSSDTDGNFIPDIPLAPGENRITARVIDSNGNISRASNEIIVVYNEPPAVPAGLTSNVNGYDVNLAWAANTEPDLSGYNLYRNSEKVNEPSAVTSGSTTASPYSYDPSMVFDADLSTYWDTYTYGDPVWWQIDLPSPELINHMEIHWGSEEYAGRDYEIRVWSGYAWITQVKVTGNDTEVNAFDFSPSYRTDKIRIYITDTTDTNYSKEVRLSEVEILKDALITDISYDDVNLDDGEYTYKVTAVDYYGFESLPSDDARTIVGDVIPPAAPQDLTASASGPDIILRWSANGGTDLEGYNVYRNTPEGWTKINISPVTEITYTDSGLRNGAYTYRVTAVDAAGNESLPSNEASAAVYIEPPQPPINLGITAVPEGEALGAAWEYAGGPAAGYNIYRSDVSGGPYAMLNASPLSEKSYTDTGLVNGAAYYYVVTAMDAHGNESAYSNEAQGIPSDTAAPPAPEIFFPAIPGTSVVSYNDKTDISGRAEPGITVELFRNGISAGSAAALAGDIADSLELDYESGASLSPDARMIAYSYSNRVWIMDISTGEKTGIGYGYWPLWSPDGKKIAYSFYDGNGDYRIAVYDAVTGDSAPLTDGAGVNEWGMSWSSGGNRLAFINESGGQYEIWLKDLAANTKRQISSESDYIPYPRLSPDGDKIAYFENNSLYIVDVAGGDTLSVDNDTDGYSIDWSPDSGKLAFVSYGNSNADIFVFDVTTLNRTQITSLASDESDPVWSPDGDNIAFKRLEDDGNTSIWVTSSHAPGQERLIQHGEYRLNYFYWNLLYWTKSGGIAYIDRYLLNIVHLRGWFRFEGAGLDPGDNIFHARAVDRSGNTSSPSGEIIVTFNTSLLPDLETTEDDIFIYPLYPLDGEKAAIHVIVRNRSKIEAKDVDADIYIWDSPGNLELIKSENIPEIPPGSWKSVSVEWDTTGKSGVNTVIAVIDPDDRITELSETNNYATREITVVEDEGVSMATSVDSTRYNSSEDVNIHVNLINSGLERDVVMEAWIEDENGNVVTLLDTISANLPYAAEQDYSFSWNTGNTYSGSYRVHTALKNIPGVIPENIVPFEILPDMDIASEVVTDRTGYGAKEDVGISFNVKNNGGNYVIPALTATLKIADAGGNTLFTDDKTITNLLPGATATFNSTWNTGLNLPGDYNAVVEISLDGGPVSIGSAPFTVNASMVIAGDIKAAPPVVSIGDTVEADYIIRNSGNTDAAGLGLGILVIDPGTRTVMDTYEDITDLAMNGSYTGSFTFSTQGYGLKTYSLALQYTHQGETAGIAIATFTVRDGAPPAVSVSSPVSGGRYSSAVDITAIVSDSASGVDRVEYRLDNGSWRRLPLSDPSRGRYSTVWEPAGPSDEGSHTVSVRATDKSGNVSEPTAASFTVEFIPPVAEAGPDRNVIAGESVTLDGSASYDPEGKTITFLWTFTEVPSASAVTDASLSDVTSAKPSFTTDAAGTYVLELTVGNGKKQDSDTVSIIAGVPNVAPNADAGPDRNVFTGSPVYLDGSASYDPDEWPEPLVFHWSFNEVPLQSVLADDDIVGGDQAKASFVPDADGAYVLELTVSDGDLSSTDEVVITAALPNVPPNADAGEDFSVALGGTVTLDGSASHDPDGGPEPLTYTWGFVAVPDGSGITDTDLSHAGAASPSFVPDRAGTYVLELMVGDGLETAYDNVAVTVVDITPPSISAVANTYELWPPNHRLVDIVIRVYTSDNSGLPVTLSAVVSSNEPVDGRCDGDTSPDWTEPVIDQDTGIITLQLRAERSGCGDGRVYTITITAEDVSGNTLSTNVEITVSRSRGNRH